MKPMTADDEAQARQAIRLLELFALNTDDTEQRVVGICQRAWTPVGPVAAMLARDIKVVAVVNFPHGSSNVGSAASEVRASLIAGADEIDVVYPFRALLGGDRQIGIDLISACSALCGGQVPLTVTLETGDLRDSQTIHAACCDAIASGVSFIKSSTGKGATHVTPQAARSCWRRLPM